MKVARVLLQDFRTISQRCSKGAIGAGEVGYSIGVSSPYIAFSIEEFIRVARVVTEIIMLQV